MSRSPAQVYDELFVPALFAQWGAVVADAAGVRRGAHVLDVACGTGVAACAAAARVGPGGHVAGVDANEEMLAVARTKPARVRWRRARAEALPFDEASFDCVVSQFGMMFFDDRIAALRQMWRVLRAGGRLAIAVCDALDHCPGYAVLAELLHRLFGHDVAQAFRAPFVLGDPELLREACERAGIAGARVHRADGRVRFDTVDALLSAERACAWTLGGLLDDAQFERLRAGCLESLAPFAGPDGRVEFVMPALVVTATRR